MTICRIGSRVGHAVLAIPEAMQQDDEHVWLYQPDGFGPTVTRATLSLLLGEIRLDRQVTAICC